MVAETGDAKARVARGGLHLLLGSPRRGRGGRDDRQDPQRRRQRPQDARRKSAARCSAHGRYGPLTLMQREYAREYSRALGRDMELLHFGSSGRTLLVFPTSMGRFYQWEDFGLVSAISDWIESGAIQLVCVDSVDGESWYAKDRPPAERVERHLHYETYLLARCCLASTMPRSRAGPHSEPSTRCCWRRATRIESADSSG